MSRLRTTTLPSLTRPKISLPQGTFHGSLLVPESHSLPRTIEQFLGIPYAAVSTPRFAPPVPIKSIPRDVEIPEFDAGKYGPRCPAGWGEGEGGYGEDCLSVNIFRPVVREFMMKKEGKGGDDANASVEGIGKECEFEGNVVRQDGVEEEEKLRLMPVVVYFHGGAFNTGSSNSRDMASFIAWSEFDIVGVSFNYRTGVFGFLPIPVPASSDLPASESSKPAKEELRREDNKPEGFLNIGLRDQLLALQWIKQNISHFGGDPNQITIMGSSAGAHSIGHLLHHPSINTTPLSSQGKEKKEALFHRVIMESGAPTARACYPYNHPLHKTQLHDLLSSLKVDPNLPSESIIQKLRELDMETLRTASDALFEKYNPTVRWPFQPVIDGPGGMIPLPPITAWRCDLWRQKMRDVPVLTGYNTNEGAMFTPSSITTSEEFIAFFRTLLPGLTEDDLHDLNELYPDPLIYPDSQFVERRKGLGAQFARTCAAYGDFAYIAPVRQTIRYLTSTNANPSPTSRETAKENSKTYLYHFAARCSIRGGADHGNQSPFVTHGKDVRNFSQTINRISGTMNAYWTSFIATGDPNAARRGGGGRFSDRVVWKGVGDEGGREVMVFGEGNDEVAGGKEKGIIAQCKKEEVKEWEESAFWWDRVEKFER